MAKIIKLDDKGVEFLEKINELSGETITLCDQCGTCSGGCPFITEMDVNPSQIMRQVMLGQKDIMNTKTMWICASCFTCTVRCPRDLDVSKVSEALRQVKLREAIDFIDIEQISKDEARKLPSIAIVGAFRKFTG
ncbi:MAG: 4Fe-4S dicluster domain-containing protein [Candidatus Cloacimonetes bacterium]|nr:4Fe-4S dicluster domain-containing protein [Candidatus Cloacimonadota bacterium]